MSDHLLQPREAARAMMTGARDTAVRLLSKTADTALGRAVEALATAETHREIEIIRDTFVRSIAHLAETPFVSRS